MTDYREQAIRDVAEKCEVATEHIIFILQIDPRMLLYCDLACQYAVAQRQRVLELEAAIREAVLHLDPVGWPIVRKELEAQLQQKEGERG